MKVRHALMNRNLLIGLALILALRTATCMGQRDPTPTAVSLGDSAVASSFTSVTTRETAATPMSVISAGVMVNSPPPYSTDPATPTLVSTPIPSPTFTQTTDPIPPTPIHPTITPLDDGQALPVPDDFLFVARGNLLHWDATAQQIETLVGVDGAILSAPSASELDEQGLPTSASPIRLVSTDEDRRRLIVVWNRAGVLEQLFLIDLETRQSRLLEIAERFLTAEISPDGAHVAYIPLDRTFVTRGVSSSSLLFYSPQHTEGQQVGPVLVAPVDAPSQPIDIGECRAIETEEGYSDCGRTSIVWSPDSESFAWKDGRGVWVGYLLQAVSTLVAEHDHEGYVVGHHTLYPAQWSPRGRYLLLYVGGWESGSYAVVDTRNKIVEHRNDWLDWNIPYVALAWLTDGRLLVTRHVAEFNEVMRYEEARPTVELWDLSPGQESLLSLQETIPLPVAKYILPAHPTQVADGRIALTLLNLRLESQTDRGVYLLDLAEREFQRVSDLPARPLNALNELRDDVSTQIFMNPEGTGAIFKDRGDGTLLYLSFGEGRLYDLRSQIDSDVCCFTWLIAPASTD